MNLDSRLNRLERIVNEEEPDQGLTDVRLALDLSAMAAAMEASDSAVRERQLAKVSRLRAAADFGDVSGLLPGDLDVRPPHEMMTG